MTSQLTLGEGRSYFEAEEAKKVESILNSDSAKRRSSYYLFKYTNWTSQFCGYMKTVYELRSRKPLVPILGTKLWLIDNVNGTIDKVWDLGRDIKDADLFAEKEKKVIEHNYESAKTFGGAVVNA